MTNIDKKIEKIIKVLDMKKALDIKVLKVSELTTIADYFVIATGKSNIQVQALCDHLEEEMAKENYKPENKEGYNTAEWILLCFDGVIVHIFKGETREFFSLEHIWKDAVEIDISHLLTID